MTELSSMGELYTKQCWGPVGDFVDKLSNTPHPTSFTRLSSRNRIDVTFFFRSTYIIIRLKKSIYCKNVWLIYYALPNVNIFFNCYYFILELYKIKFGGVSTLDD